MVYLRLLADHSEQKQIIGAIKLELLYRYYADLTRFYIAITRNILHINMYSYFFSVTPTFDNIEFLALKHL